jgi:hypothetical protein
VEIINYSSAGEEEKVNAYELKKKYEDLWLSVADSVTADMLMYSKTVAHNAAFYACSEYHKIASRKEIVVAGKTSNNTRSPKRAKPRIGRA